MVVPPPHVSKAIFAGKNAFDERRCGTAAAAARDCDVLFRRRTVSAEYSHPVSPLIPDLMPVPYLNQRIGPAPFRYRALTNVQWSRSETRSDCPEQQR